MKSLFVLILFLLLGQTAIVQASPMNIVKSNLEFTAKGFPAFLKIKGESNKLTGKLEEKDQKLSGMITLDLESLSTGIDLRDEHMKKNYLETEKFKTAVLEIPPFKAESSGTTKGLLKMRNEQKEIDIDYEIERSESGIKALTKFKINIVDFKIPVPEYQGITVAKDVTFQVDLEAKK